MKAVSIDLDDELMSLIARSRFGSRNAVDDALSTLSAVAYVRSAIGIELFLEGEISLAKAAEIARMPRLDFERTLIDAGIPIATYPASDYARDTTAIARLRRVDPKP